MEALIHDTFKASAPMPRPRTLTLMISAVLIGMGGNAYAQRALVEATARGGSPAPPGDPQRSHERRDDHRELTDAVRRVERRTGGQVLKAERVPFDGRDVNRVKVVDASGRVRIYMDDPAAPGGRRPVPDMRTRHDDGDSD